VNRFQVAWQTSALVSTGAFFAVLFLAFLVIDSATGGALGCSFTLRCGLGFQALDYLGSFLWAVPVAGAISTLIAAFTARTDKGKAILFAWLAILLASFLLLNIIGIAASSGLSG